VAEQNNLGVIAMKVYSQGALLGPGGLSAEEAFNYALSQPGVSLAIIGCSSPAEVETNARFACEFTRLAAASLQELEARTARHAAAFTYYKKPTLVSLE
jgi:predicted aldo/keto reductase-like oxidoreductase